MSIEYKTTWRGIVAAILGGGFIAGSVDIFAAALISWLSPVVILQAIASGLLGAASFRAGAPTAVLGLLLHWAMSLIIAAIYVLAAHRLAWLKHRWLPVGLAYGVVIFFVMNYLVVPLSAAPFRGQHFTAAKFIENLLAMLLFGLIVAFCARRFDSANAPAKAAAGAVATQND
jgi:uncharacterized membrane protein YagU involved in acid resistance